MIPVILHRSSARLRFKVPAPVLTGEDADVLESYLESLSFVSKAKADPRTSNCAVWLVQAEGPDSWEDRDSLLAEALEDFSFEDPDIRDLVPDNSLRQLNEDYRSKLVVTVAGKLARDIFLPGPLSRAYTIVRSLGYIRKGLKALRAGRLDVSVLDGTAITASMLRGDFSTAASIMFLLDTGEVLEEWTRRKSVADLARNMSLKVDKVWKVSGTGSRPAQDRLEDVDQISVGDRIRVRSSNLIPFDGKVIRGECTVNQASMTGESIPVPKTVGGYVYAGTVVEEGECVIQVAKAAGSGKYDEIVRMIEESEKLKSETEERAYSLADRLVPLSLAGTALTYLLTGNVTKAMSFLMVDFSCALKLSMPLSVLSAIREAADHDITVKGGKFMEAIAQADTIVLDKTGTLTYADPRVVEIVTFDGADERECLRVAACLEEHYPHSMANAVVEEARARKVSHEEMHSRVNYVVAHGIASTIEGEKAIIGSGHFVFEDEKTVIPRGEKRKLSGLPQQYSQLFLARGGRLKAAICISDPPRKEAPEVIRKLKESGLRVCMMTGDNKKTAENVAEKLGIDQYAAEVLPQDKAEFVKQQRLEGHKVIMVGDGVNDAPALSEADVGVAVSDGAAIAREISDVTIASDDLEKLVILRELSQALMERIHSNYRFIMTFNGSLIGLGTAGVIQPSSSALLHNGSTVVAGMRSMTDLL